MSDTLWEKLKALPFTVWNEDQGERYIKLSDVMALLASEQPQPAWKKIFDETKQQEHPAAEPNPEHRPMAEWPPCPQNMGIQVPGCPPATEQSQLANQTSVDMKEWLEAQHVSLTDQQLFAVQSFIVMNVLPVQEHLPADLEAAAREQAKYPAYEILRRLESRDHVLRDSKGVPAPIMTPEELTDIIGNEFVAFARERERLGRLALLIETRRVMGTGSKNFQRWLAMRIRAEGQPQKAEASAIRALKE